MSDPKEAVQFSKRYSFPRAHFLQFNETLRVRDGDVIVEFLQIRDGQSLAPNQFCNALTSVTKPSGLIEYAIPHLKASVAKKTSATTPRLEDIPPKVAHALQAIERRLEQHATRLAKSLRWRCNAHGRARVLEAPELAPFCWSLDRRSWFPVYGMVSIEPLEWQFEYLDSIVDPEDGHYWPLPPEPLAFELLMEAQQIQYDNPRSALVIAVAAAEVGTKHCLQSLKPELRGILESNECLPMLRLLDQYYPKDSHACFVPWILEELRKAVFERNSLVHTGKFTLTREQLRRRLRAIEDTLRLFDVQMGFKWAEKFLSEQTRQALCQPSSPLRQVFTAFN